MSKQQTSPSCKVAVYSDNDEGETGAGRLASELLIIFTSAPEIYPLSKTSAPNQELILLTCSELWRAIRSLRTQ